MNTPEFRSEHPIGSFEHARDWHTYQHDNTDDYFMVGYLEISSRYAQYCLEQDRQQSAKGLNGIARLIHKLRLEKNKITLKEWLILFACSIGITAFVTIFCIWLELMKR